MSSVSGRADLESELESEHHAEVCSLPVAPAAAQPQQGQRECPGLPRGHQTLLQPRHRPGGGAEGGSHRLPALPGLQQEQLLRLLDQECSTSEQNRTNQPTSSTNFYAEYNFTKSFILDIFNILYFKDKSSVLNTLLDLETVTS